MSYRPLRQRLKALALALLLCPALAISRAEAAPPKLDDAIQTGLKASGDAAIIIGNQSYTDLPDAPFASNDANAFLSFLMKSRGLTSSRIRVVSGANRKEVRSTVKQVAGKVKKGATIWFYFSGQATASPEGDRYLLADDMEASEKGLASGSFSLDDIVQLLAGTRADHIILVLDAGFGALGRDGETVIAGRRSMPWGPKYVTDPRVVVWSATQGQQVAGVWRAANHGLFTGLALGAMRGWADGALGQEPDGKVSLGEAQAWVAEAMGRMGYSQVPTLDGSPRSRDFTMVEGKLEKAPSDKDIQEWGREELQARIEAQTLRMTAEASSAWHAIADRVAQGGPAAQMALEDFLVRFERPVVTVTVSTPPREALQARRTLELLATTGKAAPSTSVVVPDLAQLPADSNLPRPATAEVVMARAAPPPETPAIPPAEVKPPQVEGVKVSARPPKQGEPTPPVTPEPPIEPASTGSAQAAPVTAPTVKPVEPTATQAPSTASAGAPTGGQEGRGGAQPTGSPTSRPVDDSCTDLYRLEEPALRGALTPGQVSCLEKRMGAEKTITAKDKASRILLVDAETRGDQERWQKTIERHFDVVGRSDPDLCFKYAVFQAKNGKDVERVIVWADFALENKDRWAGKQYEKRVYSLLRLRAEAANALWTEAEEAYVTQRSDQSDEAAKLARGRAKEFAKAWMDYARISGQDARKAEALCLAAAGTATYCSGE